MADVGKGVGLGFGLILGIVAAVIAIPVLGMLFLCGGCAALTTAVVPPPGATPMPTSPVGEPGLDVPVDIAPPADIPADEGGEMPPDAEQPAGEPEAVAPEDEEQSDQIAEIARQQAASDRLAAILADAGSLTAASDVDAVRERLDAFRAEHEDTDAATIAERELDGLASLRLAYVFAKTTGRPATDRLRSVTEKHPGTAAAKAAATQLVE